MHLSCSIGQGEKTRKKKKRDNGKDKENHWSGGQKQRKKTRKESEVTPPWCHGLSPKTAKIRSRTDIPASNVKEIKHITRWLRVNENYKDDEITAFQVSKLVVRDYEH